MKHHSMEMLSRFSWIAPTLDSLVMSMSRLLTLTKVAFKVVGYKLVHLEESVIDILENSEDIEIDLPENSQIENSENSEIDFSEKSDNKFSQKFNIGKLENLGILFYRVWRVDV